MPSSLTARPPRGRGFEHFGGSGSNETQRGHTPTMPLTFAALDVETANRRRGSVCSFGLVIVECGNIVSRHHFLCRPPEGLQHFEGFNTRMHGITHDDVKDQPTFEERLDEVLTLISGWPVVAHNATFDIGAIRSACDASTVEWPTLTYACTMAMARRADLNLLSYGLPLVCAALAVPRGRHHQADQDAEAAARIVLALAVRVGAVTLAALAEMLMVRLGHITQTSWTASLADGQITRLEGINADPHHPLYGRNVCFTGALSLLRSEAWALSTQLGATPQENVTKKTDFLVIGDGFTGSTPAEFHTGRALKAVKTNAKGGHVEVLTEGDFLKLLAEPETSGNRP